MPALEAVLADIKQRGIDLIYNLGDVVGKGPSSAQVLDRCREVCTLILRGNWDDIIAREPENPVTGWWRAQLDAERLAYLRDLPNSHDFRLSGKNVRVYHASAKGEHHRVHEDSGREAHQAMFANTPFTGLDAPTPDIVAYGDIHGTYMLPVEFGTQTKLLLNVGSAGNPLDIPLASYVVLTGVLDGNAPAPFSIDFVRLPYDLEATIAEAQRVDLPELDAYCVELRTAVYRRLQQAAKVAATD